VRFSDLRSEISKAAHYPEVLTKLLTMNGCKREAGEMPALPAQL
jgi:hypothetical protein